MVCPRRSQGTSHLQTTSRSLGYCAILQVGSRQTLRVPLQQRQQRQQRFVAVMAASGNRVVLWFRNDLRLQDNAIGHEAALRVRAGKADEVLPVFCFDPRQFEATPWGTPKTGVFRAQFLLESVLALQASLRAVGSDLLIAKGTPESVLTGTEALHYTLTPISNLRYRYRRHGNGTGPISSFPERV